MQQTGLEVSFMPGKTKAKFLLGKGQFGKLGLARNIHTEEWVGVKSVKGESNIQASKNEAKLQAKLKGKPHIMPYLDSVELSHKIPPVLYQFMPLASFGNGEFLQKKLALVNDHLLKSKILVHVAEQLLKGVSHMHAANIYHLDFKGSNMVLDQHGEVYIIDFGCAQEVKEKGDLINGGIGDTRYYSPDRFANSRFRANIGTEKLEAFHGGKADAWAVGLTLLELATNAYPFGVASASERTRKCDTAYFQQELQKIEVLRNPPKDSLMFLIKGLLDVNPDTRLSVKQALGLSLFKESNLLFGSQEEQQQAFMYLKSLNLAQEETSSESSYQLTPVKQDKSYFYGANISKSQTNYNKTPSSSSYANSPSHV